MISKHMVLIGPMGAGKTTVGKALAAKLGLNFSDADEVLLAEAGCDMETFLNRFGEPGFRAQETEILKSLLARAPQVLAMGGGVVLKAENRALLKGSGFNIYLAPSLSAQLKRLEGNKDRPFLEVPDRKAKLQELNEKRLPHYESLADLTIKVDALSPQQVVEAILFNLSNLCNKP